MNHFGKLGLGVLMLVFGASAWAAHHENTNEKVASDWIKATHKGQAETRAMVEKHMADNGVFHQSRYVGFGFALDPKNQDQMVVANVTPGTPAASVLQVGDVFESVAGVPSTRENRDRMSFRGKPGEPVKAVVKRDGKSVPIEVRRGIIAADLSKAEVLAGIDRANDETWAVDQGSIVEVLSNGNVVYVVDETKDTDDVSGLPFENRSITRFEFNGDGKAVSVRSMGEDRFVLEQLGYTIER
mgnify:CR=1 FL=1